jgi:hypothetical protein
MDWILLVGLVVAGALLLVAMTSLVRIGGGGPRLPVWVPVLGIAVAGILFALSVVTGSWLNAVLFALNLLTFSMLLGVSRTRVP